MKYRKLTTLGDYTFGQGDANFTRNTPEAVAQAVRTRLGLLQGEWFLDTEIGTPYNSEILGTGKLTLYDAAIQGVILNTPGVLRITQYTSGVDSKTRAASVACLIETVYGLTAVQTQL